MAKDNLFGPDGTAEPPPPPLLADPLAGLITGLIGPDHDDQWDRPDIPIVAVRQPDERAIRQAVDAALRADPVARSAASMGRGRRTVRRSAGPARTSGSPIGAVQPSTTAMSSGRSSHAVRTAITWLVVLAVITLIVIAALHGGTGIPAHGGGE